MATQVVRVKRDKIAACMKCPLCNKLLKEATTISLCLHTCEFLQCLRFLRYWFLGLLYPSVLPTGFVLFSLFLTLLVRIVLRIRWSAGSAYMKSFLMRMLIAVQCVTLTLAVFQRTNSVLHMPVPPFLYYRPDHNLQDIRAKIFPLKRRKVEAPEVPASVSPPAKRKERSLSSLVVSTPRVSMQAGVTGRRTRAGVRKGSVPRGGSPTAEETPKKDEDSGEEHQDGSSSPETLNKIIQNKKQSSSAKSSNDQISGEPMENNNEGWEGKVDLWKPLNTLVEAANRSKFSKSSLQGPCHAKSEPSSSGGADMSVNKTKPEDNGRGPESQDEKSSMPSVPGPAKRKRVRPSGKSQASPSPDSSSSPVMLNATRRNWKDGPIWFSLVASEDPEGGEPLPQVPSAFLRIKDGNMPVSHIQKYIVKKLDLASEAEVSELLCANHMPRTASAASSENKQPVRCMASLFLNSKEGSDSCGRVSQRVCDGPVIFAKGCSPSLLILGPNKILKIFRCL
ncbi:hypothetical protein Cgig2_000093 [Carnegiea gigantea]|uniref:Uncharacterized protein n=1 Tax=Carnegiea gigantea TaxID=171969 RepID=A0A9Q1QSH6_9CARY|nr:hypothetical protein Cgig2_000093 [Carnegiea gigantea]